MGPPGKTAAKAAKEKIVKKKKKVEKVEDKSNRNSYTWQDGEVWSFPPVKKEKIVKKKKRWVCPPSRICSATRHQNKIDKLLKMINSEEFYDWDDKDIDRLTKIIKHAMSQPYRSREEYLEYCL